MEKGVIPSTFKDDVEVVVPASGDTNWDIHTILRPKIILPNFTTPGNWQNFP
jgi:hypothetical protein